MKIAPDSLPPSAAQRPSVAPTPVQSFETVLGQAADERAFGFSELGVFGAAHSTSAPATESFVLGARFGARGPAVGTAPLEPLPWTALGERAPGVAPGRASASSPLASSIHVTSEKPGAERQAPTGAIVGNVALASEAPGLPDTDGEPGPARVLSRALFAMLAERAGSTGRVTVAAEGQSGRAQIVISAPDLTPREIGALRRAAARLTALHGFTLGRLTLNGAELDLIALD